jgi:hypothetical protein
MFSSNSITTTDTSPPPDVLVSSKKQSVPEPSLREVLLLSALTCVLFVWFVCMFRNYFAAVDNVGDSSAYMTLASAIRHWDFRGIDQQWQGGWLFGFPFYAIIHSEETSGDLVVVPATPK